MNCIYREKGHRSGERQYLIVAGYIILWESTTDFDCWDDCKAKATNFSEMETVFMLHLVRLMYPAEGWTFEVESA